MFRDKSLTTSPWVGKKTVKGGVIVAAACGNIVQMKSSRMILAMIPKASN